MPASVYVSMLESCDSVAGIVQAAQCLCELGSQFAVKALRDYYAKAKSYSLRRILVLLVASKRSGWRNSTLADWLITEADPRVRYLLARSLVGLQLPRHIVKQIRSCFDAVRGDRVRGHILEILGSQRDLAFLPLLLETLSDPDQKESVRAHALAGIGRLQEPEAFQVLLEQYNALGDHVYLRRGRHTALARCACALERRHREAAFDTLRVSAYSAIGNEAFAISAACVTLAEAQGVGIISSMLDSVDHQVAAGMRKQQAQLKNLLQSSFPTERVERLEKTIEKLEARLARHMLVGGHEGAIKA